MRRVFPYHLVLSVRRPCSEVAVRALLDLVTLVAFSSCDPEVTPFVAGEQDANIPSPPGT